MATNAVPDELSQKLLAQRNRSSKRNVRGRCTCRLAGLSCLMTAGRLGHGAQRNQAHPKLDSFQGTIRIPCFLDEAVDIDDQACHLMMQEA